ncbi:hypothetical protein RCC89_02480 [Cytophagaceae bacterium ABcell3]|nr:hypothetical protein RCC89_02480 [Cytophagaceae bacterium ABcell3]
MRRIFYTITFVLFSLAAKSQHVVGAGYSYGRGLREMASGIQNSHGLFFNYSLNVLSPYSYRELHIGITTSFNSYASVSKSKLPFERDNYEHNVANISNTSSFGNFGLNVKYIFNNAERRLSPYIEGGGGVLTHWSSWSASDPFHEPIDEYEDTRTRFTGTLGNSTTLYYALGAGLSIKLTPEATLSLGVSWQNGGTVNYRNPNIRPEQFYYIPSEDYYETNVLPPDHWFLRNPRRQNQGSPSSREDLSSDFNSRHNMIMFNVGITYNFY